MSESARTLAASLLAGVTVSFGAHAMLLWQRRQQLYHELALFARDAESPFGDDPTCCIEGLPRRAVLATWTLDLVDLLAAIAIQHALGLPLSDTAQLSDALAAPPLAAASAIAVALVSAPVSALALWLSLRVHLLPRTAKSMWPQRRWLRAARDRRALLRTLAIVLLRDVVYLLAITLTLVWCAPAGPPLRWALPLAVAALVATLLSQPLDALAVDARAAWWFGLAPRAVRALLLVVVLPIWSVVFAKASLHWFGNAGSGGSGSLTSSSST